MKIEVLGAHNLETDRARLPCLLVDDVIALDAGGLTSSLPLARLQAIRSVLLTHHHFDHTRDLITLAALDSVPPSTVEVYGLQDTLDVVYRYLLDGKMYRDYTVWPSRESPRLLLKAVSPLEKLVVRDHAIMPVEVGHSVPAVGFLITGEDGKSIFYAGDTGPGLSECWRHISPEVLFIEVTGLNSMGEDMCRLGHLTPDLLAGELRQFQQIRGYMPRVVAVHVPLLYEDQLRGELETAGRMLGMEIEAAHEGLIIEV